MMLMRSPGSSCLQLMAINVHATLLLNELCAFAEGNVWGGRFTAHHYMHPMATEGSLTSFQYHDETANHHTKPFMPVHRPRNVNFVHMKKKLFLKILIKRFCKVHSLKNACNTLTNVFI